VSKIYKLEYLLELRGGSRYQTAVCLEPPISGLFTLELKELKELKLLLPSVSRRVQTLSQPYPCHKATQTMSTEKN